MNVVKIDGVDVAFRVDGREGAPAIVFSNSLGTDLRMWDAQVGFLEDRFHIVRYDTRGHGRSGLSRAPLSIDRLGNDVLVLMDHLGLPRAHICGLSLGGLTALWLAAYHPARVDRAVFANTAAKIGTRESWSERIEAVRRGGMAAVRDAAVGRFLSQPFRARSPEVTRAIGDMIESTDPGGYVACCEALRDADLHAVVPGIGAPSLVIASELDVSTPPSQAEELQGLIAGSELVVLPGTAHLSCVESPDGFNHCLGRFLANGTL